MTSSLSPESATWISEEIMEAYIKLHRLGFAHSIESWYQGELVGGLYGIAMGAAFLENRCFPAEPPLPA